MRGLGLLALGFVAIHAGFHIWHGRPADMLWACHVATAAVGVGLLAGWPTCVGIGVLWLVVGVPLWLLDVAAGGELVPTSVLTHAGGLLIGLAGLRWLGLPDQLWWKAWLALAVLQGLCRWLTPERANVNVAFAVYPGWERCFPSYRLYLLTLAGLFAGLFFVAECGLRRLLS